MILENEKGNFADYDSASFINIRTLTNLRIKDDIKEELFGLYALQNKSNDVIKVGNSKSLIDSLNLLDSSCEKRDIDSKVKNVLLEKLLEDEKSIFEIFKIDDDFILKNNGNSDKLKAETAYSAKSDLLEIFSFSKFAKFCKENKYDDLIDSIRDYLKNKNLDNNTPLKLRIVYKNTDKKFYIRAITSTDGYKDFGINFSVLVALMSINTYVGKTGDEFYIDNYIVSDSKIYVSFRKKYETELNTNLSLRFGLILENDEIKRNAVSFNGVFTLVYRKGSQESEVVIRPKGMKSDEESFPTDLLTYRHQGKVESVIKKVEKLPELIEKYISQVSKDAKDITERKNPDSIRELIAKKIKDGRKSEFKVHKTEVLRELNKITVDNMFKLFELLGSIEKLFDKEDVMSIDYWRSKLYEALIEKK